MTYNTNQEIEKFRKTLIECDMNSELASGVVGKDIIIQIKAAKLSKEHF